MFGVPLFIRKPRRTSLRLRSALYLAAAAGTLLSGASVRAQITNLPYSNRILGYSGWSTTLRGDIRTIGMAGAMVGIADSFIASGDNPAGLAMTLHNTGVQITGNHIHDGDIQSYSEPLTATTVGTVATVYPWGFGFGFWVPQSESELYRLPNGTLVTPEVLTREFRFSIARSLLDNRLSVGLGLILGQAGKSLEFPDLPQFNQAQHNYGMNADFGAMYQLPKRWLIGLSYTLPVTYDNDTVTDTTAQLTGFLQPVKSPYRLGVGVGWLPNRFFTAGATVYLMGSTSGIALLSDQQKLVGQNMTIQPRLGASYTLAEFKDFKAEVDGGTYFEVSRVEGIPSRMHGTGGLEFNVWIFNLGWGIDEGPRYENFIYSLGVDFIRIMRKLELIPQEWHPPYGGFLPPPFRASEEGMSRPLVKHWVDHGENPDVLEITRQIPKRLGEKVLKTGEELKDLGGGVVKAIESVPTALKKKAKKKKPLEKSQKIKDDK